MFCVLSLIEAAANRRPTVAAFGDPWNANEFANGLILFPTESVTL